MKMKGTIKLKLQKTFKVKPTKPFSKKWRGMRLRHPNCLYNSDYRNSFTKRFCASFSSNIQSAFGKIWYFY